MGVQKFVMVSDPHLAHEIFVTKGTSTSDRPYNTYMTDYYSHGSRGIACSNANKAWKKARTAALTFLAPRKVDAFSDMVANEAQASIHRILTQSEKYGQFNPMDSFQSTSMNVILTTSFGKHLSPDDPLFKKIVNAVTESLRLAGTANDISGFLPVLSFLDVIFRKKRNMEHFVNKVHNPIMLDLMKEALESENDSFYKQFYALKDEYDLDEKDLLVSMSDLIAAGVDTTSVTLTWLTIILSNNPKVQTKLQQEIDDFIQKNGRLPNFNERDQVPYLIAVQREAMRFRPIGPFGVPHVASNDVIVRDYLIEKGTVIVASMAAMHSNPDVYEQPEVFNPDRFLGNTRTFSAAANGSINDRDQYNFGWGRRICPGIYLAEMEMFHNVTRLAAYTTIAPPLDKNGNEVPIDMTNVADGGLVTNPKPFELRFIPRTDVKL
ncbi:unnamed protein product [Cunninghamella echinulata]